MFAESEQLQGGPQACLAVYQQSPTQSGKENVNEYSRFLYDSAQLQKTQSEYYNNVIILKI